MLRLHPLALRRAGGELVAADDERERKALLRGDFQLLADPLRLGRHLHRHPRSPQGGGDPQVIPAVGLVEVDEKDVGGGFAGFQPAELFEPRKQSIDPQRRPDPREVLLGVEAGEIVVAPSGTDAPQRRQLVEEALEHQAGVVVEAAGDRGIDDNPPGRHARLGRAVEERPQAVDPGSPRGRAAGERLERGKDSVGGPGKRRELEQIGARRRIDPVSCQLRGDPLGAHLAELVEGPQHDGGAVGEPEALEDPG